MLQDVTALIHALPVSFIKAWFSITQQMPRPRHKNKVIIRLSRHSSHQSLCLDSKLVVVVVVIGLMKTRLKYCYELCIPRQMVARTSVIFCMKNTCKIVLSFPFHINSSLIKLENFVMQLKSQSVVAWQNEKHYSKENNTSENPIQRRENFQVSQPCEVRRSGQVRTFVV